MKLRITDEAMEQLKRMEETERPIIRLFYDTEGCGCGVNGLPMIRFDDKRYDTDKEVENEAYPVVIDDQQSVFFKQEMKLDFAKGTFRLSSPDGILNPIIPIKTVKGAAV
ncbi:iron-sulfur cluster biosynthesis family protein [Halobacillus sp. ACCC02827]|uniref:iron-sulfur cluster biosynthesis family protein n=1 Tax=Bacillaceae TaxID=186817 RepID=UPI0002A4DE08|nr:MULTISPECIES: iron-sulfur cluster biosynthesis family protein [Bacillaceae]ELK44898.1 hypothetical protein D479_17054 [Halobacillus sp. BAB-2008]QHT47070.1 iron-sulfur cluster biosynthesis family protein [Bacillus sp. SB49]WJE14297.1 iron-sulfur cluster biosynthesis family protein [Halobacillus sp. ACCC02827]